MEPFSLERDEILSDYRIAYESRQVSLIGNKEVRAGKARFGVFGDGKEVAQMAMAKIFRNGDFRAGYYRDQTLMMAIDELSIQQYFAQLYADTDVEREPATAGRCMNAHFATRSTNPDGSWNNLMKRKNSSADVSCTAGKIATLVGLAYASKLYRNNPKLASLKRFSNQGNEIAFGTIGNGSCAEGVFFEAINAGGVLKIPILVSIWDDDYAISVPNEYQVTKGSISKVLSGFQKRTKIENGCDIFCVKGWDYENLVKIYAESEKICRNKHIPVIVHVTEMTQPQGHSTDGSHKRYKSVERLTWEKKYDCITQMRQWILDKRIAIDQDLREIEEQARKKVIQAKNKAWESFNTSIHTKRNEVITILEDIISRVPKSEELVRLKEDLQKEQNPIYSSAFKAARRALWSLRNQSEELKQPLTQWLETAKSCKEEKYNSWVYSESPQSALKIKEVKPIFEASSPEVNGFEVLQTCFSSMLSRDPRVLAIGEDLGKIGGVNQGFAGLQEKYGSLRVTDTGIREATIVGQGIGTAQRGLRPIIEIQYLDYIYYALQTLTDDLACLQYRTKGGQKAPLILRTRGHRLQGVWHSGSPMSVLLGALRGIYVLVPRNMTQASGFYNTMLQSDDAAIIIEPLAGYRSKERIPKNMASFTVPLGIPDILREGKDITIVTYGTMCKIVMEAAEELDRIGICSEVIDVQTLMPFDIHHNIILESIKKTNRVVFADEDVPGGATAYMMQKVVEEQNSYHWLDSKPVCLSAREHRPAYGTDGNYFSKPNTEDVFETVYQIMNEFNPKKYPSLY